MRTLFRRLNAGEAVFDFIGSRKRWYLVSALLLLVCIGSFVFRGFNLGIEAAQVLIALCFLAATYPLRTLGVYARGLLPVGSAGALVVAGLWFIDRAFALAMVPF